MSKIDDGGPAFPQNDATTNRINNLDGMSLRDWFAGQALAQCQQALREYCNEYTCPPNWRDGIAAEAYQMADAMLDARKGGGA